ncbi:MAG: squalene--hopene cyclase [Tildeniella torsiva UHER 1998/13D]|jgi:squalene-hopene/tetraprenyl-beta-curcumene cyclase|nr:squalene--hopene cyclase [Tildeniella torsiva UHER 1998/13D]
MQTQEPQQRTGLDPAIRESIPGAIAVAQNYLLALQHPDGYWWAELESNVTITAEIILLHKIWGTDGERPLAKAEHYLRSHQRTHGGWELFYGDGGDLSTSVEAYTALRVLGVPASDPALLKAKAFILSRGGITKTRIFTKLHLALIGCYDWRGLPSLPAWVMLLESPSPFTIYELSSWARGSTVPLLVVFDQKPVYKIEPAVSVDELYAEGIANVRWELPKAGDWSDIFIWLDGAFKFAESINFTPFRDEGLRKAEQWILERQEATGDWGGIIPAMLNSMLALRCLGYDKDDPVVRRGLRAIDNFAVETDDTYWVQACVSPVWDTALGMRSLTDSGFAPDHPSLVRAGEWLLEKQILDYGDWIVKNPQGKPGGWAFEFENRFYPDVDDTAVVAMALQDVTLPDEALKREAIARAVRWVATMQCKTGGWAAFDIDNDQDWLNAVPYGDLKAMIDPSTADITARVLEMHGRLCREPGLAARYASDLTAQRLERGLTFLLNEQEADGSWFGRWGVNYLYGTSGALSALALIAPERCHGAIARAVAWLVSCQNPDGGWGETCRSYDDPSLKGQGPSTPSQTAWALLGLLDTGSAGAAAERAIQKGVRYLLETQTPEGTWEEQEFTGTGFPRHFYIRYHLYRHHFPLMALGRCYHAVRP